MTAVPPPAAQDQTTTQSRWFAFFMAALFLAYWWFAWRLERVDLAPLLTPYWQNWAPFLDMPRVIVFAAEMLHWRVLRHLAVPILGWNLAYRAAVSMVRVLYDLPDNQAAKSLLRRLQATNPPAVKPLAVNGQTLAKLRETKELLRVGGPGKVAITSGEVAVTEINGRFQRILGPGTHTLTRLEHIQTILDLRPQERTAAAVPLTTRDGIEVHADITVTFRLDTGGEFPSQETPYPYDEEAVRMAAYNKTVLPDGSVSGWSNAPAASAKANLTQIIANYPLDELLYARTDDEPYKAIRTELIHKIRPILAKQGIELTGLHISRLELPEDVTEQYIQYWQTHWETQAQLRLADGKAMSLEEVEIARAEAEMTMIQAIVEGVQRARQSSATDNMHEIIALRLVEALEKMAKQTQQETPLPITLLPQIDTLRRRLEPGAALPDAPETGNK